jgi:hypothetical protein
VLSCAWGCSRTTKTRPTSSGVSNSTIPQPLERPGCGRSACPSQITRVSRASTGVRMRSDIVDAMHASGKFQPALVSRLAFTGYSVLTVVPAGDVRVNDVATLPELVFQVLPAWRRKGGRWRAGPDPVIWLPRCATASSYQTPARSSALNGGSLVRQARFET